MIRPAIVLVRPQLGMNIGMAARAMWNFELDDMRLVAPRDGWPNPDAGPAAAGADRLLSEVRVHADIASALADCTLTFATTVRPRHMDKPVITPREAARRVHEAAAKGQKSAILFGPERSGLSADDLAAIQTIVTCPVNPDFGSLNLAQAVLLIAHEWYQSEARGAVADVAWTPDLEMASHAEVTGFLQQLIADLEAVGYFNVPSRTPATKRMLAQMLTRPEFTSDEVRSWRGIIRALTSRRRP